MRSAEITEKLLAAKKQIGLSFADLGRIMGGSEVWVAALIYRQAGASREEAEKLASALGLGTDVAGELAEIPLKGLDTAVPSDPLLYRLHEILQVYGMPIRAVVHEKFGDGIMSAVDLTVTVDKEEGHGGDRVRLTFSGKFLPYKKW
jgi:cyanate lyase